ncbi:SDR family oxidoreductase [Pseudomarimonas arenosa]|uniref:SDR family oxidoreductase n=1 Tax=Pseudomarimonas arenosa TaxID=2774145 RepID=A0AAW3ZN85_9GAMM|nr:SDR family oxidoreductase [Pseudomarimonas arenosa]MBD8527536.1 SDR family oxidoreductase [Pseudomarimonas arenosa]
MQLDLRERNAIVCGGSAGIGFAVARQLAALGARVVVLARDLDRLQTALEKLPRIANQQHGMLQADAGEPAKLGEAIAAEAARYPIHILINNSGGPPGGSAHQASLNDYETAFRQQLLAAQAAVQATLPGMQSAQFGRVINIVSTSVREPIAGLGVSNTVRAAVAGWAKTLSRELATAGITVNNVLPGYTQTQRLKQIISDRARSSGKSEDEIRQQMLASVPAGRFADAEEVANAVAFLASPAASYISGVSLAVDGGRMQSI